MNKLQIARQPSIWISAHGRTRCRQRGTSFRTLAALLDWADVEVAVGSGATAFSLSAGVEEEMRAEGLAPQLIAQARRRAAVGVDGQVITVIVGRSARSRRYRHCMRTRAGRQRRTTNLAIKGGE